MSGGQRIIQELLLLACEDVDIESASTRKQGRTSYDYEHLLQKFIPPSARVVNYRTIFCV